MEKKEINIKDAATQAVEVIVEEFKKVLQLPLKQDDIDFRWIDCEGGTAEINNGLMIVPFTDMLVAVHKQIPYQEIQDCCEYNARLVELELDEYVIPLEEWIKGAVHISDFELAMIEKTKSAYECSKREYEAAVSKALCGMEKKVN